MTALSIIVDIILILISILLIVVVLMQEGQRQGLGAIGGGAETFFGKNKAQSMEGKLQRITRIAVAAFVLLAIVATIITSHIVKNPAPLPVASTATADVVEEAADEAEATEEAVEETATEEAPAEETATEEAPAEEVPAEEAPAEEAPAENTEG